MSKGWDNATLKKLKALMGKGLSTSEIGRRLGLSKNAVVGKLNRMGWNAKAGTSTTKSTKKSTTASAKKTSTTRVTPKKPVVTKSAPRAAKKSVTVAPKTVKKATSKKTAVPTTKKTAPKAKAVPAKKTRTPSATSKNLAMHQRIIQHSLELANLKPNQCRWPIGDPDSENFHFCGKQVFTGKPYCYEHCRLAYQFTPPKKK